MADTFTDLDTVAAAGNGTLWKRRASRWAAAGAQPDGSGSNVRLPVDTIADGRVQAALAAKAWVPLYVDQAQPPHAVAVVKSPAEGEAPIRARTMAEMGAAA